jgi:hypothetical protein
MPSQEVLNEFRLLTHAAQDPVLEITASAWKALTDRIASLEARVPEPVDLEMMVVGELAEIEAPCFNRLAAVEAEVQRLGRQLLPHEEPWHPASPPSGPAPKQEEIDAALEALAGNARAFADAHAEFGNDSGVIGESLHWLEQALDRFTDLLARHADARPPLGLLPRYDAVEEVGS